MLMRSQDMIRLLNPNPISFSQFEKVKKGIIEKIERGDQDIVPLLEDYWDVPYYFTKEQENSFMPSIRDAARLYVLINYLLYGQPGSSFDRKRYYEQFFTDEMDEVKQCICDIAFQKPVMLKSDVEVDVVLGSIYKIKRYFLENNRIKDIRGASAIIKYMNEDVTMEFLSRNYIEECAVYCGGGNVLVLVPKGHGEVICKQLESRYAEISLTAKTAFEYISCTLNELFRNYNRKMNQLNHLLEERKKIKVYPINPDNELKFIQIGDKKIDFSRVERIEGQREVCKLCAVRDAKYKLFTPEGEVFVCPSCMRKSLTGNYKAIFYEEYQQFTGAYPNMEVSSISDLQDKNGRVAVIYADGNNMGNVVMNIQSPFEHMYFSRKVDYITKKCVYDAIRSIMGDDARFEAIALGGDDVFIIVPGDVSLEIANEIVKGFDESFDHIITMSAGICIAKHTTPIQNMFKVAQHKLKSAKNLARNIGANQGTVDIEVIQSNINIDLSKPTLNLFPADSTQLSKFINIIKRMKNSKVKRSQLYKLRHASRTLNPYEFQLFYAYQITRLSQQYSSLVAELFDVRPEKFSGLIENTDREADKPFKSPWEDIVVLWDCIRGGGSSAS
ncbi:hypothetical protein SAMN05444406_103138 [Caldicoprobacter faecalis]|uniref:GGDEF domain-containing protein n=2 Tax=Caldicoprobacter faecalis TaxID=937334 RepID=A0A1I5T2E3_9FIRM|nr:hypothetical protein SAMN05444406_103138 [Caldicoprobacter faecalis]